VYLKKLELIGFKSFHEKTQFLFNPGITCIVGPNGCGKSNLLDALRWVLGEQRTSLLRGSKMEEVIFAGTRTLKPLGMAEVSLHIDNREGGLPTEYRELSVARRLYRSGDSEYIMNKVPCRLKDITDMFADTGIGAHAYAIIQQDMVDAILSDKTEERRFLFEEAAGITKYKYRKKAAERKLEATEHDLIRLQDILAEVTTRVNSLRRQVKKAERYKKVSDELKNWDLYKAQSRYAELREKRKTLMVSIKDHEERKVALDAQLDSRFANLEEARTSLADLDGKLADLATKVFNLSEQAHQVETDISVNREKRDNLLASASQNKDEIEALSKREEVIRDEKAACEEEIHKLEEEIARFMSDLESALQRQKSADEQYLQFRAATEDENIKLMDLEGRLSSGRTDSANIEEQISDQKQEIERQTERKTALLDEKARRREEITSIQGRREETERGIVADENRIKEDDKALIEVMDRTDRLRDQLAESSSSFEATLVRKNLLTEMVEHYEGYGSGVVAVFDMAARWVDITGTVADFIRPKDDYQTAIEAALGETAQFIICQNRSTAREVVTHLREKKAGRATFLILDHLSEEISHPSLPDIPGLIGWGNDLVDCDDRYRQVPTALLGRTAVCENAESAQRILEHLSEGYRIVTLNGEVYTRDGLLSGGASEEISLIGRKNEIEALDNKLIDLNNRIKKVKEAQAEAILSSGELRQSLVQQNQKLADDKDRLSELISRLKEEQFKINAAEEVVTSIDQQIDQITQKLEKLKHRQYSLTLNFDQLDKEKATVAARAEDQKNRLNELEKAASQAGEEVNRLQVTKVEMESKRSHHESQIEYYEEMQSDIASNITQKKQHIEESEQGAADLEERLKQDEIRLRELFDLRQQETGAQQGQRQSRDEMSTKIEGLEEEVKNLRRDKDLLGDERHQAEVSLTAISSKLEQLEERMEREYQTDIRDLNIECPNSELSPEAADEHIGLLREKMNKMGIVNLLALEEWEQQKERKDFLARQLDDLFSAKATLKATIQKINQTAKAMFLDTMDKARTNFKDMYNELFTGGEADVILEDESNPLESRIEIISRPKGKKPLTIAQLSGGERALTAISLLFALYMVKPSPFCFLDEIDAPLDDVNVGRFLKIVSKFSRQTQFIIITHNKITMEASDTLYGVTMEEPGVSKVVAVRFKKGDEDSDNLLDLHYSKEDATRAG
jgi:chromosome segregation protein